MKVNFNTNQANISANKTNNKPSFGKLIIERDAAEAIKKQYRNLDVARSREQFIETFTEYAKRLNDLPLVSYLKTYISTAGRHPHLLLEVHDSSEGNFLKDGNVITSKQDFYGNLGFMKSLTTTAEQLQKDNDTLIKMFKEANIEVVENTPVAKPAVDKCEAQNLADTLQAKAIIEENDHPRHRIGEPATNPLDWPC